MQRVTLGFIGLGLVFLVGGLILGQGQSSSLDPSLTPTAKVESSPSIQALDNVSILPKPILGPSIPETDYLVFTGDIMLDRSVWQKMQANGFMYPFTKIGNLFAGADLVIGNLEGPITTRETHASPNGPLLFNFDPGSTQVLKQVGFSALSLANNHTYNQGKRGLTETKEHLRSAGLEVFGHPREVNTHDVFAFDLHGHRYAFVGWNMIEVDDPATDTLLTLIRELNQSVDRIVVLPHWGAEYRSQTTTQVEVAHALIEAGADLIIGAHPHVVQGVEVFGNRPILYSLGNFIFDQYWSQATQEGLAVRVAWTEQSLAVTFLPIDLHASQPHAADEIIGTRIMERILESSTLAESDRERLARDRRLELAVEE